MSANDAPDIGGTISPIADSAIDGVASVGLPDISARQFDPIQTPAIIATNPFVRNALAALQPLQRAEDQASHIIVPRANTCDRLDAPPQITP